MNVKNHLKVHQVMMMLMMTLKSKIVRKENYFIRYTLLLCFFLCSFSMAVGFVS